MLTRRAFLKLSVALSSTLLAQSASNDRLRVARWWPTAPPTAPDDALATHDLLLVPAYLAAEWIQRRALAPLASPPGRAHDPEGAFTIPHVYTLTTVIPPTQPLYPLWHTSTLWPSDPRVLIGLAFLRRGYLPNDPHPGHIAQIERDVLALRPQLARGQLSASATMYRVQQSAESQKALQRPPFGTLFVEYDWVIPSGGRHSALARAYAQVNAQLTRPNITGAWPLAPLSPVIRARLKALADYVTTS